MLRFAIVAAVAAFGAPAFADPGQCHVVDVEFTPSDGGARDPLQIVVWIEDAAGNYVDTIYITQQTGIFGMGNRPGRFDFNSGPMWPYGRRIMTFPVWAHRKLSKIAAFPAVIFQNSPDNPDDCWTKMNGSNADFSNCGENNLSHQSGESSHEDHYCQPLEPNTSSWDTAYDAMTCATPYGGMNGAFTDKGRLSPVATSLYPPRIDVVRNPITDDPSVDMYKLLAPFDAISQATPPAGTDTHVTWPIPQTLAAGDYVAWVEVSKAFDTNASYDASSYPPPAGSGPQGIYWSSYGAPFRGQPSIVYQVPFSISTTETVALATDYAGYGDPNGADGDLRPPDATITTDTPGSGASRLQLVADTGAMFRVRVDARPESDFVAPAMPAGLAPATIGSLTASLTFVAPGDDGTMGKVSGYEIRIRANDEMSADNFADSMPVTTLVTPVDAGGLQTIALDHLLPETDYWIGVQAYDDCHNTSDLAIAKLTTLDRQVGEVNACFIATAAYGSVMANDVELLRHFRDMWLQTNVIGELAVETYYTFGPAVAGVVGESELLRHSARAALAPIVTRVRRSAF